MKTLFQQAMHDATGLTRAGKLVEASQAIRDALSGGSGASVARGGPVKTLLPEKLRSLFRRPAERDSDVGDVSFGDGSHTFGATTREFKLYVPAGASRGLVLMLHGCTQDPADFARGTRMNETAGERGLMVLYPAQSKAANPSACWNWFEPARRSEEARFLVDLTRTVVERHRVDPTRVYVAGLSAGGAMATVVAEAAPDLFAAVGVHSGLSAAAADNLPDALTVMRSGRERHARRAKHATPSIVFHGTRDHTVHPDNGEHVASAIVDAYPDGLSAHRIEGASHDGRRFVRTEHVDDAGAVLVEHWALEGAGHAWSGGDARGSHVDAGGVDASAEMLRFFESHPRRAS